jgi:putative peptidoglycan lipid II flippase
VVVRLASSGTAEAALACGQSSADSGTGYTIYSGAFLLVMVPHSIATVSLATAVLPRLSRAAAAQDLPRLAAQVASTTRTALALIVPFALLLPAIALPLANVVWGYAASSRTYSDFAVSLSLFAPGLVFFTVHYLMLRGFYALERTRTVFWVQCVIAATNIVLAVLVTSQVDPQDTAPGLVCAYAGSYAVGAVCSYLLLRSVLGGLETPRLVRFLVRLLIASALAAGAAWAVRAGLLALWPLGDGKLQALTLLATAGLADLVVLLAAARAMRITEVTEVVALVSSRLRR